jgi:hypothetical protein
MNDRFRERLRRWCEELQRDVVRVAKGETGSVARVDDTAVSDAEFIESVHPLRQFVSVRALKRQVIETDTPFVER